MTQSSETLRTFETAKHNCDMLWPWHTRAQFMHTRNWVSALNGQLFHRHLQEMCKKLRGMLTEGHPDAWSQEKPQMDREVKSLWGVLHPTKILLKSQVFLKLFSSLLQNLARCIIDAVPAVLNVQYFNNDAPSWFTCSFEKRFMLLWSGQALNLGMWRVWFS